MNSAKAIIYYNIEDLKKACGRLKQLKINFDVKHIRDNVNILIIF